ncbi:MAG: alpha/beta hydrolase [Acidobacteriaceae bacterium]|nr:alpha/beta hydrolase [Acidobacteriaceae bacterium]
MAGHVKTVEDLRGPAGRLEALLNTGSPDAPYAVVVAHPQPLGGGTMHHKVVYHATKAFTHYGLPVLRFNYRGVGLSEGSYTGGPGEMDDLRAALDWMEQKFQKPLLFAGFSFGSNIGLRVCCGDPRIKGLVGLGLPVNAEGRVYTYDFLPKCGSVPKLFIIGKQDAYAPYEQLSAALEATPTPRQILWVDGADHFFEGTPQSPASKLGVMREALRVWLGKKFEL